MEILLSNDDGIHAPGLVCLAGALAELGSVTVIAPDRDRSGASNSLTLDSPLRVQDLGDRRFSVNGTPTDCVHLGITGFLERPPDMVVSGINSGANLGDDVHYSGTVAAAMEGRFLGLPAIAVSLAGAGTDENYRVAAEVTLRVVHRMKDEPLPADTILNINVPDVPAGSTPTVEVTRLGHRHRSERVVPATDPKGRRVYWVGPVGQEQDAGPGTDFHAIRAGHVSVTPLQVDMTRHGALESLGDWFGGL